MIITDITQKNSPQIFCFNFAHLPRFYSLPRSGWTDVCTPDAAEGFLLLQSGCRAGAGTGSSACRALKPQGRHGGLLCTPLAPGCVPLTAAVFGGNSRHFSLAFTAHSSVLSPSQVAGEIRQLWQHLLRLLVAAAGGSRAVVSRAVQLTI